MFLAQKCPICFIWRPIFHISWPTLEKGWFFFEENQEILKVYLVRKFSTYHQQDQVQLIIKPNSSHTFSTVDCPKAQYLHKPKKRDKKAHGHPLFGGDLWIPVVAAGGVGPGMVSGAQPPVPVKSSCSRPAIKPSHWWSQSEASDQPLWLAEGKAGEASLVSGWRGQGSQLGGGGPGGSGQWPGGGSQLASWRPRARTYLVKICSI